MISKCKQKQVVLVTKAVAVFIFAAIFIQCSDEKSIEQKSVSQSTEASDNLKSAGAHWSYDGDTGPEFWGELDPKYILCAEGLSQSPIDIDGDDAEEEEDSEIIFHYQSTALRVINNGHAIEVKEHPVPGSYITIDGSRYDLLQFHFHSPSEHTISGKSYPVECHFVHSNAAGELLVIGVLYKKGDKNKAHEPIFSNLPAHEGDENVIEEVIDIRDLLPGDASTYRYSGSLTTPPCSEGVKWNVIIKKEKLSALQIEAFMQIYDGNNRPVLPLNGRTIYEFEED